MCMRTTSSTSAPVSCSNAADSSALWPLPMTITFFPAKQLRSRCSELCDTTSRGSFANSGGRHANAAIPVATTTRRALQTSPSSSVIRKLSESFNRCVIFRESVSGATWRWNHRPYLTNRSSGTGAERWLSLTTLYASSVKLRLGSERFEPSQGERRSMPVGMWRSQNDIGSPNT